MWFLVQLHLNLFSDLQPNCKGTLVDDRSAWHLQRSSSFGDLFGVNSNIQQVPLFIHIQYYLLINTATSFWVWIADNRWVLQRCGRLRFKSVSEGKNVNRWKEFLLLQYVRSSMWIEIGNFQYKYYTFAYSEIFNPTLRTKILLLMVQLDLYNVYYVFGYFTMVNS